MSLIRRLRERALFQWAAAYAAAAWLGLEVLGFLADNFLWPPAIVRGATIALAVGFLLVLVLAWFHGERGRQRVGGGELLLIALVLGMGGVLVAAFAPSPAPEPAASPARALLPQGEERRRSVAVLPFENLSPDADDAFFADAVHESVLTRLSQIAGLRVLSRSSMVRYRDTELSLSEIADEVGAGAVLRGSVQRAGDRIRITAGLVDPASEESLWADQFDGTVEDLFDVQSTVALAVAEELEAALGPAELEALARAPTEDVEALDFYLRGRGAYESLRADDNEEALRLFRLAIAEDSTFAEAWASLGWGYIQRSQRFGYPREWIDSAEVAGRRAIALDTTLADGYRAVGAAYALRGRNAEGAAWFERALARNPGLQPAMANLAVTKVFTGHWDETLRWAKRAFELDPTSPQMRELLANAYQDLRAFEIAERWLGEALERDPRSPVVRRLEQALAILRGEPAAGYETLSRWIEASGEEGPVLSTIAATGAHYAREFDDVLAWSERAFRQAEGGALRDYHDLRVIRAYALSREDGLSGEAYELLADAERDYLTPIESGADSWLFPLYLAAIHLVRGSSDEGLAWFERAGAAGFNGWNLIEQDPIFDPVRDDARYRETIATMRGRLEAQRMAIEREERAAGDRR